MGKNRSQFRRKFMFIGSLFIGLTIFVLGVEVGQRFSGPPLRGQKRRSDNRITQEKGQGGFREVLDNSPDDDIPDPEITFYDSLKGEEGEEKGGAGKPAVKEARVTPREKPAIKSEDVTVPAGKDAVGKTQAMKYALQWGSYKNRAMAEEIEKDLKRKGYDVYIFQVDIPDKGTWYRIKIGTFDDLERVKSAAADIQKREGVDVIVTDGAR